MARPRRSSSRCGASTSSFRPFGTSTQVGARDHTRCGHRGTVLGCLDVPTGQRRPRPGDRGGRRGCSRSRVLHRGGLAVLPVVRGHQPLLGANEHALARRVGRAQRRSHSPMAGRGDSHGGRAERERRSGEGRPQRRVAELSAARCSSSPASAAGAGVPPAIAVTSGNSRVQGHSPQRCRTRGGAGGSPDGPGSSRSGASRCSISTSGSRLHAQRCARSSAPSRRSPGRSTAVLVHVHAPSVPALAPYRPAARGGPRASPR